MSEINIVTERGFELYQKSNSFHALVQMLVSHVLNGDLSPKEISTEVAAYEEIISNHRRMNPRWEPTTHEIRWEPTEPTTHEIGWEPTTHEIGKVNMSPRQRIIMKGGFPAVLGDKSNE